MSMFIGSLWQWIVGYKYVVAFLSTIIEGPVAMISSGFLYHLGAFSFWPLYFSLVLADFVADLGWYCLGRFGTRELIFRFGQIVRLTPTKLEKIEKQFRKYHQKILIISKLTMGLGFATVILIVAGMFKVPFKNYLILNIIGGFIWTGLLLTVGYFFGNVYALISGPAKVLFAIGLLLIVFFGFRFANNYLAEKEL